jgi:hypothetical protein
MEKLIGIYGCLILLFFGFSAKPQTPDISGKYSWKDPHRISSAEMSLNPDGTFQYWFQAGDSYTIYSEGNWSYPRPAKRLLLSSKFRTPDSILKVEELRNNGLSAGTKRISIYDSANLPVFGYVMINPPSHGQIVFRSADGVNESTQVKDVNIREIAVSYLGLGSRILFYTIKDTQANDIKIFIQLGSIKTYRFFDDQKWLVAHDKLIDTDTTFNKGGRKEYGKEH